MASDLQCAQMMLLSLGAETMEKYFFTNLFSLYYQCQGGNFLLWRAPVHVILLNFLFYEFDSMLICCVKLYGGSFLFHEFGLYLFSSFTGCHVKGEGAEAHSCANRRKI